MQKRKTFSREFRLEAVRLLDRGDKSAADEGVPGTVYRSCVCEFTPDFMGQYVRIQEWMRDSPAGDCGCDPEHAGWRIDDPTATPTLGSAARSTPTRLGRRWLRIAAGPSASRAAG